MSLLFDINLYVVDCKHVDRVAGTLYIGCTGMAASNRLLQIEGNIFHKNNVVICYQCVTIS